MFRKAFTLIELLVVISIVALLSSVVMASLNSARDKARIGAGKQFSANMYHAIADEAVGVWNFDECLGTVTADLSGNNNAGSLMNGASWSPDTPSGTGCSILFDGSDDYVRVLDNDMFTFPTATMSMSTWVKFNSISNEEDALIAKASYGDNQREWAFLKCASGTVNCSSSSLVGFINNNALDNGSGGWLLVPANAPMSIGIWYHIAVSVDNGKASIYVNGANRGSALIRTTTQNGTANVTFGMTSNAGVSNQQLSGRMDEVRIYSRAITALEVSEIYAANSHRLKLTDNTSNKN